jgi:hypothetical protein
VTPNESQIEELRKLERAADKLLSQIADSAEPVSFDTLRTLERIGAAAATIANGAGNPKLLTEQMQTVIQWTDHLDDTSLASEFEKALSRRPLASPWI